MRLILIFLVTGAWILCAQVPADDPPQMKIVLISGSNEYFSDISLSLYKDYLERQENARVTLLQAGGPLNDRNEYSELSGVEALAEADVALFFLRRTTIAGESLGKIKEFINAGKGVVALRTSSHGLQNWPDFDKMILGGNYSGHHGGSPESRVIDTQQNLIPSGQPQGPTMSVHIVKGEEGHPILNGIIDFRSRYSLYKTSPVANDVRVLMTGEIPEQKAEPLLWIREWNASRIVYIGLGGLQDWENATFMRLVTNALYWAGRRSQVAQALAMPETRPRPQGKITLAVRTRTARDGDNEWQEQLSVKNWQVAETAIVVCDMWDKHWCDGATARCETLAKRMNPVLALAREKGIQIIHAPSSTLYFYSDWPQRRRMQLATKVQEPKEKEIYEPPLPIKDKDGCDTQNKPYSAWTRQSPLLDIGPLDGITDDGKEVYNFFSAHKIKNMIIMGVHTNMCVLGRSFGIRQMTKWGVSCVLVRDLTDAMYDPKDPPYVSHEQGVELVVQHIEKYWCPSTTSQDLVSGLSNMIPE
jgi:type 1 glutamine amidotransferase/nicotinamidase-related amidase